MKYYSETVCGTCGVSVFYSFSHTDDWGSKREIDDAAPNDLGGAGWVMAGFIDTEECKIAYEELLQTYTLVYQSPVRLNENSNNQFFFCIFDGYKEEQPLEDSWSF